MENKSTNSMVKWLNPHKRRNTLSNMTFNDNKIYELHTEKQEGFIPYVPKSEFDKAIKRISDLEARLQSGE